MLSIRLKASRKALKLTQEDLAKKVNSTKGTISNYENGHSTPSNEMLVDLANVLNTTTDYLLGRDSEFDLNTNDFDSLTEVTKLAKEYKLDQFGFFDVEKWKNLSPEDVEEVRRHFEWVAQKAKERNLEKE